MAHVDSILHTEQTTNDPALIRKRGDDTPAALAFGVNEMVISYFMDGNNTDVPDPLPASAATPNVRRIRIDLKGITRHRHKIGFGGTATYRTKTLSTTVKLRNLGL